MAKARALDDLRVASEAADRLAAERFAAREARRAEWAAKVAAGNAAAARAADEAVRAAQRAFAVAAEDHWPAAEYIAWIRAIAERNTVHDRHGQAQAALGTPLADGAYPIRDQPNFAQELSRALGAAAWAAGDEIRDRLQAELNELDGA